AARGWSSATAHNRAQVLYYIAENLAARAEEFADRLRSGLLAPRDAAAEVELSIERLFRAAAYADKYDGQVHPTPFRNVTLAMPEPIGVLGIVCTDQAPLLGFVSAVAPALAMGNRVVIVPSERAPLAATDMYQVFDTSDLPGGAVNIVTGLRAELAPVLAAHDDVDGIWYLPADLTDQAPLLGFVSAVAPALAMGNRVVIVPSERAPLAATDMYQVFDTSDLPGGAVNIVTGLRAELAPVLAAHDDVDGIWYFPAD